MDLLLLSSNNSSRKGTTVSSGLTCVRINFQKIGSNKGISSHAFSGEPTSDPRMHTSFLISSALFSLFVSRLPSFFLQQHYLRRGNQSNCRERQPPVWPSKLLLVQRRIPDEDSKVSPATTVTYYDASVGANLIQVTPDDGGDVLWDLELNNMSYYFTPSTQVCQPVKFPVGVLRQKWLDGAQPLGESVSWDGSRLTCGWTKSDFIDYFVDKETGVPTNWYFHNMKANFEVLYYEEDPEIDQALFQPPDYCFFPK